MNRWILILAIVAGPWGAFGQEGVEFWTGPDPGAGAGTFVPAATGNSITVPPELLSLGAQQVGVRIRNSEGNWSLPRVLTVGVEGASTPPVGGEYFWDSDPGVGAGIPFTDRAFEAETAGLDYGLHILGIRIQDADDQWGSTAWTEVEVCSNYNVSAAFEWDAVGTTLMLSSSTAHASEFYWFDNGMPDTLSQSPTPSLVLPSGMHHIEHIALNECDTSLAAAELELLGAFSSFPQTGTPGSTLRISSQGVFDGLSALRMTSATGSIDVTEFVVETDSLLVFDLQIPADAGQDVFSLCAEFSSGIETCLADVLSIEEPYSAFASEIAGPPAMRNNLWTPYTASFTNEGNEVQVGVPVSLTIRGNVEARMEAAMVFEAFEEVIDDDSFDGNPFVETFLETSFFRLPDPLGASGDSLEYVLLLLPFIQPGQTVVVEFEILGTLGDGPVLMKSNMGQPWYAPEDFHNLAAAANARTACDFLPPCLQGMMDVLNYAPGIGCLTGAANIGCTIGNCINDIFLIGNEHSTTVNSAMCAVNVSLAAVGLALCGFSGASGATAKEFIKDQIQNAAQDAVEAGFGVLENLLLESTTAPQGLMDLPGNLCECIPGADCGEDDGEADLVASIDPNEKTGPLGVGEAHWIPMDQDVFHYRIECENADSATAPAAHVIMIDTLDSESFNFASLRFTSFEQAGQQVDITPPSIHFIREVDLRPEKNSILRVEGGLDTLTGVLTVDWISLDPETRTLSFDIEAGFLNPNVTAPEGQAWFDFDIALNPEVLTHLGSVDNVADIYFDGNEAIRTPVWSNSFDDTAPSVGGISSTQASDSTLSCIVDLMDSGSGVQWFDAYELLTSGDTVLVEHIGSFGAKDTVILPVDPTVEHQLILIGEDGVGNRETWVASEPSVDDVDLLFTPPSCTVDFDADGTQGIGDLLLFLTAYGAVGDLTTDLNGDGATTAADLIAFLPFFGAPCD